MLRVGSRFGRVEPRRRARAFVLGLLAELPRKNCWTIAEQAGDATPDGMQHLLARARWDADGMRDDLRGYIAEYLGDPDAVLVVDETGDLKKGTATAGVQRQYTGTAGRIENAQVAVYLGYAAPAGHALIDRELYLPQSWTGDPDRCAAAGIPADVTFATKPQLARRMIQRAVTAGVPFAWTAADEVYGDNGPLRAWLEEGQLRYVLAVSCDHRVPAGAGHTIRADELAARLPRRAWQRLSAGEGAKGHRYHDWAWTSISDPRPGHRWLLIRRTPRTGELAFYRCYAPHPVPLATLVNVAGRRWTVEENFQAGKGLTGLDEHQVRRWTSWYRWATLTMLAAAFLTITAAAEQARTPAPAGQIPLTRNEIAHLLATLTSPARGTRYRMRWSRWRRRHQYRAQACHYQRQSLRL
ncbi:MAG TPA: IS701 family transposase [Streptosporangiaceae bacterium]|nr:IS701 family transposase [Streptosporangiaceae bacterium]